jgi:phage terminase small subunit
MASKLTDKQKKFVEEYLIDLNATQAATRAGYSKKTAYSMGQRLLKNVEIQAKIQNAMDKRSHRTEITQDWVLEELRRIAASNGAMYAKVVTKERYETIVDENGDTKQIPVTSQFVELTDTDKLSEVQESAISGIEQTRNGIKVSTYDKIRALELLGKHLGMFNDNSNNADDIEDISPLAEMLSDNNDKNTDD